MITMLNPNAIQNGSITQEMIDAPVLDAKQNITDESLATTSKEVVGAINELFNGGVKDKSIEIGKLAQAVQDTLETVVTNQNDIAELQGLINTKLKIIKWDTDLNTIIEDGLYLLSAGYKYTNYPHSDGETTPGNFVYPRIPAILIVSQKAGAYVEQVVFSVSEINLLPLIRNREYFKSIAAWGDWNNDVMYDMWKNVNDSVKKQDLLSLTDTEVNNIWDNN